MSAIMGALCILPTWFLASSRRGYAARSPCFPVSLYCWGELLIAVLASRPRIMRGRDANASSINPIQHPQQLLSSCWGCCSIDAPGILAPGARLPGPISRIQGPSQGPGPRLPGPWPRALASWGGPSKGKYRVFGPSQGPGARAQRALLRVNIGYLGPPRGLGPGPRGPF